MIVVPPITDPSAEEPPKPSLQLFRNAAHALGSAIVALVTVATIVLLGAARLYESAPVQALPENLIRVVGTIAPEGWGFFTKSPRDESMRVWVLGENGQWRTRDVSYTSGVKSLFGIDREPRTEGLQLAFIANALALSKEKWLKCTVGRVRQCIARSTPTRVVNPSPIPVLCGELAIESYSIKPFEWRSLPNNSAPAQVARFDVDCPARSP